MSRKVFISFLGFSNYGACHYVREGFKSSEVRYIQEATLRYLMDQSQWTAQDAAYILLTEGAENRNWVDNGQLDREGKVIEQTGLKTQMERMNLPFVVHPIRNLPDGNNEKEIWQIFERIFEVIEEGDELYFDLTHGFRYLPMLILVLGNYSKFLKKISVGGITYGNYESRNRETNEAPIIDLLPLSELQDWTSSAVAYLTSGNITLLNAMCNKKLVPILKETKGADKNAVAMRKYMSALEEVVSDMNTCRGINIVKGEHIAIMNESANQLNEVIIEPMKPIIHKLKDSFQGFIPSENVKNGYVAAKWCFQNKLYQQSLTILQETIISHICENLGWDINKLSMRDSVSKAFNIYSKGIENDKDKWVAKPSEYPLIEEALANETFRLLSSDYFTISGIRNDYNHAGMRDNPISKDRVVLKLKEELDNIMSLIKIDE